MQNRHFLPLSFPIYFPIHFFLFPFLFPSSPLPLPFGQFLTYVSFVMCVGWEVWRLLVLHNAKICFLLGDIGSTERLWVGGGVGRGGEGRGGGVVNVSKGRGEVLGSHCQKVAFLKRWLRMRPCLRLGIVLPNFSLSLPFFLSVSCLS